MKKYFIFILIILISCNKEKDSFKVTDKEIYEVINFVLKDTKTTDSLDGTLDNYIVDKTIEPSFFTTERDFERLEKYVSTEDFEFMKKQLIENNDFKLEQNKIIRKKIISNDTLNSLWNNDLKSNERKNNFIRSYHNKFGNNWYEQFSLPLFSKDGNKAFIEISTLGSGRSIILVKTKKGWKSTIISIWVS